MPEFAQPRQPYKPRGQTGSTDIFQRGNEGAAPVQPLPQEEQFDYQPDFEDVSGLRAMGGDPVSLFGPEAVQRALPEGLKIFLIPYYFLLILF